MSRKEQVKRAIRMEKPDYIPLFLFNGDRTESDIIQVDLERFYLGEDGQMTEWGFRWASDDPSIPMGSPSNPPLEDWDNFEDYVKNKMPDPFDKTRFEGICEALEQYGPDRYYMGSLYLTGFTIMSFIRGYCNLLEDIVLAPDRIHKLADLVFGFENDVISQMKAYGFDAVSLWDDWGTQTNLMIEPGLWRSMFKPYYEKQIALAHKCGLDVFFHTCGYVYEIIPDLIELGVDMLNLGQPDINGIEKVGKEFAGKICFCSPVSYQTTSLSGTPEEIRAEIKRLVDCMSCPNGGFMPFIINYENMGMTKENYDCIVNTFKGYGHR